MPNQDTVVADLSRLRGDATLDTGATTTGVACLAAPASSPRADRPARYKAGAARRGRTYWVRGLHRAAHSGGQPRAVVTRECARLVGCVTPAAAEAKDSDPDGRDRPRHQVRATAGGHPATSEPEREVAVGGGQVASATAAPEGSLRRDGIKNPVRRHQPVTARNARIRRPSQSSTTLRSVSAWLRAKAAGPFRSIRI